MSDFNATKYKNEFAKETYDRVSINFPKGKKAIIEAHWKALGYKSLNAYVNTLIQDDMNKVREKSVNIQNSKGFIVGDNGTIHMK